MDVPAFSIWDESIHFSDDQQKRISSAQKSETSPQSIDIEKQCAEFSSSGKKPYHTTLSSCTCVDFCHRKLPCKHIYRLAMQCGIINAEFKSGKNKNTILAESFSLSEMVEEIEKLNESAQKEMDAFFHNSFSAERYTHIFKEASCDDALFHCKLINEIQTPIGDYLRGMKKDDIASVLARLGIEYRNKKKAELIALCESNYEKVCSMFSPIHTFVLADSAKSNAKKASKYIQRKFEMDSGFNYSYVLCSYPYESRPSKINPNLYYFPNDEITALLTKYGKNKCLNGFDIRETLVL